MIVEMKIIKNKTVSENRITELKGMTVVEIPLTILSTTNKKDKTVITFIVDENDNLEII